MNKTVQRFEFVVEGIDQEQANTLLEMLIRLVEFLGAKLYGGVVQSEGEDE